MRVINEITSELASPWALNWDQTTLLFSWDTSKINISISVTEPNLNYKAATSTTVVALRYSIKRCQLFPPTQPRSLKHHFKELRITPK